MRNAGLFQGHLAAAEQCHLAALYPAHQHHKVLAVLQQLSSFRAHNVPLANHTSDGRIAMTRALNLIFSPRLLL